MSSIATMRTWPQRIHALSAFPELFVDLLEMFNHEHWPYCIYVPENQKNQDHHPAYTMILLEHHLLVGILKNDGLSIHKVPYKDIYTIEKGVIYLYGWITFSGLINGKIDSETFRFNTVQEELFEPIIERIRKENTNKKSAYFSQPNTKSIQKLSENNLKLYNYSSKIFHNESPLHTIYQPQVSAKVHHTFAPLDIPNQVLHMTQHELIMIQEPKDRHDTLSKRGGTWHYLPLSKINSIDLVHETGSEVTRMEIQLVNNGKITYDFAESKEIELYKITTELDYIKNAR